ncbi:MAG: PfkB family carbohydrate kinase, partial [Bacteroidota bacterium]
MSAPTVICFGEVLWDLLPTGKLAGGAPMNVAYHLQSLGVDSAVISRVGNDELGRELHTFMTTKGINTNFVGMNYTFPTGTVAVELDEGGSPA